MHRPIVPWWEPSEEPPEPSMGERLQISDVARFLGVSRQRVQQLGRAGRLPPHHGVDGIGPWWMTATIQTWAVEEWWGRYGWRMSPRP